jgi:hypothetical protein
MPSSTITPEKRTQIGVGATAWASASQQLVDEQQAALAVEADYVGVGRKGTGQLRQRDAAEVRGVALAGVELQGAQPAGWGARTRPRRPHGQHRQADQVARDADKRPPQPRQPAPAQPHLGDPPVADQLAAGGAEGGGGHAEEQLRPFAGVDEEQPDHEQRSRHGDPAHGGSADARRHAAGVPLQIRQETQLV